MKLKSVLVLCLVALFCVYLLKTRPDVAKVLPRSELSIRPDQQQVEFENPKTKRTFRNRYAKPKVPVSRIQDKVSIYKSEKESEKTLKSFSKRTYLEIPDFKEFAFADFSEDEIGILVGKNENGDKLTLVATREVPNHKDVINLLKNDPSFLQGSDPNFRADLMRPVMATGAQNGFSGVHIWKSRQNDKDYYMFFAPRADGKGSYGILLDGKTGSLENNEDYYEKKFLEIRARAE
jgi:hypothetical protein